MRCCVSVHKRSPFLLQSGAGSHSHCNMGHACAVRCRLPRHDVQSHKAELGGRLLCVLTTCQHSNIKTKRHGDTSPEPSTTKHTSAMEISSPERATHRSLQPEAPYRSETDSESPLGCSTVSRRHREQSSSNAVERTRTPFTVTVTWSALLPFSERFVVLSSSTYVWLPLEVGKSPWGIST